MLAAVERKHLIQEALYLLQEVLQGVYSGAVSEQTYYRWRRAYGGMDVNDARRLKELERENARLKRLVADQALDMAILREAANPNF